MKEVVPMEILVVTERAAGSLAPSITLLNITERPAGPAGGYPPGIFIKQITRAAGDFPHQTTPEGHHTGSLKCACFGASLVR